MAATGLRSEPARKPSKKTTSKSGKPAAEPRKAAAKKRTSKKPDRKKSDPKRPDQTKSALRAALEKVKPTSRKPAPPTTKAKASRKPALRKKPTPKPTKPATAARPKAATPPAQRVFRFAAMLLAFAGTVAFAVVLARLTLEPSAASVPLTDSNLRPGESIRRYLDQPSVQDAVKQLGGNIALGVPLGVLLPVLLPWAHGVLRVPAVVAPLMVGVELVQGALVTGRVFDIDDVILNTTGALLGYLILGRHLARVVHPKPRRWWRRFIPG